MRLEILFQFIVPLTFLAIWALTSLLNRDTQPLPQRPMRPGVRPGPGPGPGQGPGANRVVPPGERGAMGTQQASAARDLTFRAAGDRPAGESRPATNIDDAKVYIMDDEVVFVDPVTNRRIMSAPIGSAAAAAAVASARNGPKPQRQSQARKPGRGRRAPTPARESRSEPETPRALSDQVSRSMSLTRSRPLDLTPLSSKFTPLSASMSSTAPARDLGLERSSSGPVLQAREVKDMLGTPLKLRETILLAEILQPPVSMRRRLRSR